MTANGALSRNVVIALAVVYLVWSSTYYALRIAVEELPALSMCAVRFFISGAILCGLALWKGSARPTLKQWLGAILPGGLLFLIGNGFVSLAEVKLSSAIAAVVVATMPMFAAAVAPLFGERSRGGEWLGMSFGLLGVIVLASSSEMTVNVQSSLLLFVSPMGWALGSMFSRKLPQGEGMFGPALQMLWGAVFLLIASRITGEPFPEHWSARGLMALVYLIAFGSIAGFTAYSYLLKHTRPSLAMSYSYVNPPLAVVIGAVLGNEAIGKEMIGGVAFIVTGTYFLMRASREPAPRSGDRP